MADHQRSQCNVLQAVFFFLYRLNAVAGQLNIAGGTTRQYDD